MLSTTFPQCEFLLAENSDISSALSKLTEPTAAVPIPKLSVSNMVHSARKHIRRHRHVDESPLNSRVLNSIMLVRVVHVDRIIYLCRAYNTNPGIIRVVIRGHPGFRVKVHPCSGPRLYPSSCPRISPLQPELLSSFASRFNVPLFGRSSDAQPSEDLAERASCEAPAADFCGLIQCPPASAPALLH